MSTSHAFVPGHVTLFFTVHRDEHPGRGGSRGAGIAIDDGVRVEVRPGDGCRLNGEPVTIDPVDRVLDHLGVEAAVDARTPLPLGTGFGVSGAMALGTALAANEAFELALTENRLVDVAHRAEVQAMTGLGDVVAQHRGGIAIRTAAGDTSHGAMDAIPARPDLEYLCLGSIDTADVIGDDTATITAAGQAALEALIDQPTVDRLFIEANRFAADADLMDPAVAEIIESVRAAGGRAAMAMLGRTVVALDGGLTEAGYDASSVAVDPTGARVETRS